MGTVWYRYGNTGKPRIKRLGYCWGTLFINMHNSYIYLQCKKKYDKLKSTSSPSKLMSHLKAFIYPIRMAWSFLKKLLNKNSIHKY